MNKLLIVLVLIAAALFWLNRNSAEAPTRFEEGPDSPSVQTQATAEKSDASRGHSSPQLEVGTITTRQKDRAGDRNEMKSAPSGARSAQTPVATPPPERPGLLTFVIEDGLAIVQGDIVLGQPSGDLRQGRGWAKPPSLKLWPSSIIPFHIQPNVQNPERILQAMELFAPTNIRFVPYENQEDVLVFEDKPGVCRSYLGRIGGKQPVWISSGCSIQAIAHEIMHALGFLHEQNRSDRDQYISVAWENIEESYQHNFEKFPDEMMTASGLSSFDFESVMTYTPSMFSKNGRPTMRSKTSGQELRPGDQLSAKDIERINRLYPSVPEL